MANWVGSKGPPLNSFPPTVGGPFLSLLIPYTLVLLFEDLTRTALTTHIQQSCFFIYKYLARYLLGEDLISEDESYRLRIFGPKHPTGSL